MTFSFVIHERDPLHDQAASLTLTLTSLLLLISMLHVHSYRYYGGICGDDLNLYYILVKILYSVHIVNLFTSKTESLSLGQSSNNYFNNLEQMNTESFN